MPKIAIVGVGNCCCSLAQAISAIRGDLYDHHSEVPGHCGAGAIDIVAAFDVDKGKVGTPFKSAIFSKPNCTSTYFAVDSWDFAVSAGILADGLDGPLSNVVEPCSESRSVAPEDITQSLRASGAEIVVLYLPVGSQRAADAYASAALAADCALVNCTPAVLANSSEWRDRFSKRNLVLLGDDMKSHIGSTAFHQLILGFLKSKGIQATQTYQLNVGGNTDFLNMRDLDRSRRKRNTKAQSLESFLPAGIKAGVGPSDFIPHLKDRKVGYIRVEGTAYLGMPFNLEMRLEVEDSPNAAPIALDSILLVDRLRRGANVDLASICGRLFKAPGGIMISKRVDA